MDTKGFSLLEMIIVMAILSICSTIVGASMNRSAEHSRARYQAEKIQDALVKARNAARYQLRCVTVDVQPDHLDITTWDECSPLGSPRPTETINFDPSITLTAFDSGNPLQFNVGGGTTEAAPSIMEATTSFGSVYRYKVTPAIGAIAMVR